MNEMSSNNVPSGTMMYLIHHMFLPPKLPHADDYESKREVILLETTIDALRKFKDFVAHDQHHIVDSVTAMVTSMKTVHDPSASKGGILQGKLEDALKNLCRQGKYIYHNS